MKGYEINFIFDALLDEKESATLAEKARATIRGQNGEIKDEVDWGRRKLAYPINRKRHGFYKTIYATGDGEMIAEINRQSSYDSAVLKCYPFKVDNLEEAAEELRSLLKNPEKNVQLYQQSTNKEE